MTGRRVSAVITAGGTGRRFGGDKPKQFVPLNGVPVLARTLSVFDAAACVTEIIVAVPAGYEEQTLGLLKACCIGKAVRVTAGGPSRQASVFKALQALDTADIVLIHDGVRPFVTERTIRDVAACAARGYAAVAGIKMTDTIKKTDAEGRVLATVARETLWRAQTPQGFVYDIIIQAHTRAAADGFTGTDDAALVERLGLAPVMMVTGGSYNIKITAPPDMAAASALLRQFDIPRTDHACRAVREGGAGWADGAETCDRSSYTDTEGEPI